MTIDLRFAGAALALSVAAACQQEAPPAAPETPAPETPAPQPEAPEAPAADPNAHIEAALGDPARPEDQRAADVRRKPGEMLAFAEIEPGDVVGDFVPGGGYFTRIFSKAVGPDGKVYAFTPDPESGQPQLEDITGDADNYANVEIVSLAAGAPITSPEPLDVIWTAQNYHDLKNLPPPTTTALINGMILAMVKPGGLYIIVDHSAADDAPDEVTETLHRIREAQVRAEVEAAGFVFVESSDVLSNPDDPLTNNVFEDEIRGNTDQFVLKFRKPE
ncbi:MAG: methyltransferase [Pseudomonadota bacterium]